MHYTVTALTYLIIEGFLGLPMNNHSYMRPPITEAVIEIRFSQSMKGFDIGKAEKNFRKIYATENKQKAINVTVNINAEKMKKIEEDFVRFSSNDMTQIFILKKNSFIVSQLAPYTAWENLIERFERDYSVLKKHAGHQEIIRIGVRYINRIDIPHTQDNVLHESEYLNIYPKYPSILGNLTSYTIQQRSKLDAIMASLTINSAVVPSPLANHTSILLDIDIGRDNDLPQNINDVLSFLNQVRNEKNSIFEACITERARGLFQ